MYKGENELIFHLWIIKNIPDKLFRIVLNGDFCWLQNIWGKCLTGCVNCIPFPTDFSFLLFHRYVVHMYDSSTITLANVVYGGFVTLANSDQCWTDQCKTVKLTVLLQWLMPIYSRLANVTGDWTYQSNVGNFLLWFAFQIWAALKEISPSDVCLLAFMWGLISNFFDFTSKMWIGRLLFIRS